MAINKIVYFAHVWFLVSLRRPLTIQPFEAWQHGPLIQDVYHSFKKAGDKPILDRAKRLDRVRAQYVACESRLDGNELALLMNVINHYLPIPAAQLRNMTHIAGGPWAQVWNYEGNSNPGMVISDDLIVEYYRKKMRTGVLDAYPEGTQSTALRTLY